jgi:galactose mutarotase-like enzyme
MSEEKIYKISNGKISAEIGENGAQLKSFKDENGKEYMWCADPKIWGESSPILFPVCGAVKDKKIIYDGKDYAIPYHGFACLNKFMCKEYTENTLELYITETETTLSYYPFRFKFSVRFEIKDNFMCVSFITENTDDKTIYFSAGAHDGFALPGGLEDYDVVFDEVEDLNRIILDGKYCSYNREHVETEGRTLHMKYTHFLNDSLVFDNIKSKGLQLLHKDTKKGVRVDFPDFKFLVMWTLQDAPYLCIEPWNGLPDFVDSDMKIEHKVGIFSLEPGKKQIFMRKITPVM